MFSKFEILGAGASVFFLGLALYLTFAGNVLFSSKDVGLAAQVAQVQQPGVVVVDTAREADQIRSASLEQTADNRDKTKTMVIDDVKIGVGEEVKEGDVVAVHYAGTLQDGQEFDNSRKRGEPFEFKVGAGMVIEGWDKGLIGMKVGGQRTLVIPPEMAYGERGIGPIPGNATLVFAIELVEIK
jgi:FKBP-type peptidyl-prolyl cis-trans isomerase